MELETLALVPLITGVVQIGKNVGLPAKYAQVFSLVLGLGLALVLDMHFLIGIAYGLAASGLYDGVRSTVN